MICLEEVIKWYAKTPKNILFFVATNRLSGIFIKFNTFDTFIIQTRNQMLIPIIIFMMIAIKLWIHTKNTLSFHHRNKILTSLHFPPTAKQNQKVLQFGCKSVLRKSLSIRNYNNFHHKISARKEARKENTSARERLMENSERNEELLSRFVSS